MCSSRVLLSFLLILSCSSHPVLDRMDDIIQQQFNLDLPSLSSSQTLYPSFSSAIAPATMTEVHTTTPLPTPTVTPISTPSMTRTIRPEIIQPVITTPVFPVTTTATTRRQTPTTTILEAEPSPSGVKFLIPTAPKPSPRPQSKNNMMAMGGGGRGGGGNHGDPLVFDMNHDGNVTASLQTGISMDPTNWFARTGGATGGDKMLAMCDLNKNGIIDGTEVFGDLTKFPLLGKNELTYNGFVAIRKVARSLEAHFKNISIVRWFNGSHYVMLNELQSALRRMDCDLGFISEDNRDPHQLEPLGDALGIDISKWTVNATENIDLNGMAHYQQGRYMDQEGRHWKANDVWFKKH